MSSKQKTTGWKVIGIGEQLWNSLTVGLTDISLDDLPRKEKKKRKIMAYGNMNRRERRKIDSLIETNKCKHVLVINNSK